MTDCNKCINYTDHSYYEVYRGHIWESKLGECSEFKEESD